MYNYSVDLKSVVKGISGHIKDVSEHRKLLIYKYIFIEFIEICEKNTRNNRAMFG
jgi:hypothetical protein